MTLIVEDGTMPVGANSYASVADADAYLVPRSLWPETPQDDAAMVTRKESALMRATDYLNTLSWVGYVEDWQRTMAWPREDVPIPRGKGTVPGNIVPSAVAASCMEMAALIFGGTDPLATVERGGMVTSESHSKTVGGVDVIEGDSTSDSYTYASGAPSETYYPQLRGVEPFLTVVPGKPTGLRVFGVRRG